MSESRGSARRTPYDGAARRRRGRTVEERSAGGVVVKGGEAELVGSLGDVRYHYRRDGRLISKRVRFFLFEFRSGSPEDHDHEIEDAHWLSMDEASKQLTYPGEREMVQNALPKSGVDR